MKKYKFKQAGLLSLATLASFPAFSQQAKKNVLFIMADDFNYWNGLQGYYPQTKTPNVDKLASKGILFTDAHCSSPVSNPSRNALWSGFRPSTTGIQGNADGYIRDIPGFENIVTMNQYFKENGYWVYGAGKLYHPGSMADGGEKDAENWSERYKGGTGSKGGNYIRWKNPGWDAMSYNINPEPMTEENCEDFKMVNTVAKFIGDYSTSTNKDKPFFIACGVFRPHLPWNVPKEFWDKFNTDDLQLPKGYKEGDLYDMPGYKTTSAHKGVVENGKWKEAIHAYLAALALADFNVGILVDALEKSPYNDNTIICFMGDHGWQLGEKERWGKATLLDAANRTTLIIYDPTAKGNGQLCKKVVNLQDLYPTLVELCNVPVKTNIEGNSIVPLLENPTRNDWEKPIMMSYNGIDYIKTNEWRYVRDKKTDEQLLFDSKNDPLEFNNLRHEKKYEPIITRLNFQLDSMINIGQSIKTKLLSNYKFTPKTLIIPGRIEAEDYDEGGCNQTYFDTDKVNKGGKYRTADGVDISVTDDNQGSYQLIDIEKDEWWNYTVKNVQSGKYDVSLRVKNPSNKSVRLQLFNREVKVGEISIPTTNSKWKTFKLENVNLGDLPTARLKFKIVEGKGLLLNWFEFEFKHALNEDITANSTKRYLENNFAKEGFLQLDLTCSDMKTQVAIFENSGRPICKEMIPGEQKIMYQIPAKLPKGKYLLQIKNEANSSLEIFNVL